MSYMITYMYDTSMIFTRQYQGNDRYYYIINYCMITFIIHQYKKIRVTKNILTLWFLTIARWDLLEQLEKGVKMYKDMKADKKIFEDLSNNYIGNGYKERSSEGKSS